MRSINYTLEKVEREIQREQEGFFRIAICGLTNAGKSMFLSALIGQSVLPSEEMPATAWPCRIRHVINESPRLTITPPALQMFTKLHSSLRMKLDFVEKRNYWGLKDSFTTKSKEESLWYDLHPGVKNMWNMIKGAKYKLRTVAEEEISIVQLLGEINVLARLGHLFSPQDLEIHGDNWPVLEVTFQSLVGKPIGGNFELFDVPGIGELEVKDLFYKDLISYIRKDVYATIPIISLPLFASQRLSIELLKDILGIGYEPPFIICSHCDLIRNKENVDSLASQAWRAFSAEKVSLTQKPEFEDIYGMDESRPEFECSFNILGQSRANRNYVGMTHEDWLEAIEEQLLKSGITDTVDRFTRVLMLNAQTESIQQGLKVIYVSLIKLASDLKSGLEHLGRSAEECILYKNALDKAQIEIKQVESRWIRSFDQTIVDIGEEIKKEQNSYKGDLWEKLHRCYDDEISDFKNKNSDVALKIDEEKTIFYDGESCNRFLEQYGAKVLHILDAKRDLLCQTVITRVTGKIEGHINSLDGDLGRRGDSSWTGRIIELARTRMFILRSEADLTTLSGMEERLRGITSSSYERHVTNLGRWPCPDERTSFIIGNAKLVDRIMRRVVYPFLEEMERKETPIVEDLLNTCKDQVKDVLRDMLNNERQNCEKRLLEKGDPPVEVIKTIATSYVNIISITLTVNELKSKLENVKTDS